LSQSCADFPAVLRSVQVLFGDGVRLVAHFEHRVVAVDRDAHDLLSLRFALGAAAHPVEEFVETVLAERFRHALKVSQLLRRHVGDGCLEAALDKRVLVSQ